MKSLLSLIAFAFLAALSSRAEAMFDGRWELVGGAMTVPLNQLTTSPDASKTLFGEMYLPLGARYEIQTLDGWIMRPGLLTTLLPLFPRRSPDQALTKDYIIFDFPLYFERSPTFAWKAGAGLYWYQMKGSGGKMTLDNGTGTAEFDLPSRTQTAKLFALDAGAAWTINENHLEIDLISFGFFSNQKRTFLLSVTFGVPL